MKKILSIAAVLASAVSFSSLAANNYSCDNLKPVAQWEEFDVVRKHFKNGVSYTEIKTVSGNRGVRLSGQGISGGLCFDSVGAGKTAYAKKGWHALGSANALGDLVKSVSSNPTVQLRKIAIEDEVDNFGIGFSGGGVSGSIGFEDVVEGLKFLAFYHNGIAKINGRITGDDASIKSFTNSKGQKVVKMSGKDMGGSLTVFW